MKAFCYLTKERRKKAVPTKPINSIWKPERLDIVLKLHKMKQLDLAKKYAAEKHYSSDNGLENAKAMITRYKRAKRINYDDLLIIAKIVNVSPEYLAGEIDAEKCVTDSGAIIARIVGVDLCLNDSPKLTERITEDGYYIPTYSDYRRKHHTEILKEWLTLWALNDVYNTDLNEIDIDEIEEELVSEVRNIMQRRYGSNKEKEKLWEMAEYGAPTAPVEIEIVK